MYKVDNTKIGKYLQRLIEKSFKSHREFCRKYLGITGAEVPDEELRKMGNRLSQILKGKKGVQIYDLPAFSELLGVSCEEILSAGKYAVPTSGHTTNYDVAFSKNPSVWKSYIEREDKLILNCDEYGKTLIDYVLEFKNYDLLKYLLDQKVIWLVDNSGWDGMTYGAGTEIKRREIGDIDTSMPLQIKYQDQIRTQAIALAIENKDAEILDKLMARENPGLHNIYSFLQGSELSKYYNEDLCHSVANADEAVLDYFSQEFIVEDRQKHKNTYIYPFIGDVIDIMLAEGLNNTELLIRRSLAHNKLVYEKLSKMVDDAYKIELDSFTMELDDNFKKALRERTFNYFSLSSNKDMVSYFYSTGKKQVEFFLSNIVLINGSSPSAKVNELINESNEYYKMIIGMKEAANE